MSENKVEEIVDDVPIMKEEISEDLGNIPIREPKPAVDAQKYKGLKVKIAKVVTAMVIDYYTGPAGANGMKAYNLNSTEKKKIVEIETESLPEIDENGNPKLGTTMMVSDGKEGKKPLIVSARFNLKKDVNKETGAVEWVISKAPTANLWAFMRKQGVTNLPQLKGTIVVLDAVPSADESDNRFWLRISI